MTWVLYFAGRWAKPLLVTLGWGACLASLTLGTILQGTLVPGGLGILLHGTALSTLLVPLFYLGFFGTCVIGSLVLKAPGTALLSFLVSYALAGVTTYWVLVLPGVMGLYPAQDLLIAVMVIFTFDALFPFPLIAGLMGTLVGMVLAESLC